jgi:hypothetical protein
VIYEECQLKGTRVKYFGRKNVLCIHNKGSAFGIIKINFDFFILIWRTIGRKKISMPELISIMLQLFD